VFPRLSFSYLERSVNNQKLTWHDQITAQGTNLSSAETLPVDKVHDLDFGASVLAYSDKYWFGLSMEHFLKPNQSFYAIENDAKSYGYIPFKYSILEVPKLLTKEGYTARSIPACS
jgi:hypothetical protein